MLFTIYILICELMKSILYIQNVPYFYQIIIIDYCVT